MNTQNSDRGSNSIHDMVSCYYTEKVKNFGTSAKGVDWNSTESQHMRFQQLMKITEGDERDSYSIIDYGCGYGALYGYLKENLTKKISYTGYDLSTEMIARASDLYPSAADAVFISDGNRIARANYLVASGIFNVKLDKTDDVWLEYILETLNKMNNLAESGFAFNVLTSYSDPEKMRPYLYYADSCFIFDYCKRNFSKYIALLHDYPIYEFSILVRKDLK